MDQSHPKSEGPSRPIKALQQHNRFFRRTTVLRNKIPSDVSKELIKTGFFVYHGSARRNPVEPDRRGFSEYYLKYLLEAGKPIPMSYLFASGNVSAELKNLSRYCKPQPTEINQWEWNWAQEFCFNHIYPHVAGCRVVSQDVAWQSLEKTTSPGYPWSLLGARKSDVWNLPGFQEYMAKYYDTLGTDDEWTPVWTSSVKSEMRPTAKVLDDRLRTFVAAPLEHTLASARVYLDFCEKLFDAASRQKCWIKVGMSKYKQGWHHFVLKLMRQGLFNVGKALDVSKNDSSLFRKMYEAINAVKIACLNPMNPGIMKVILALAYQVVHGCIILANGDIVQKETGNNSGSNQTTIDNSLSLLIMLAYSFANAARQQFPKMSGLEIQTLFENSVEAALYGDDLTFTVSDDIVGWFNAVVVRGWFSSLGYELTEDDGNWDMQPVTQLTFLSNKSVYYGRYSLWVPAPVDGEKIRCSLLYGSKCQDPRWHVMRACALLVESYWDVDIRRELSEFIGFMMSRYSENFVDGVVYGGVTWREIKSLLRSSYAIEALYVGKFEDQVVVHHGQSGVPPCL